MKERQNANKNAALQEGLHFLLVFFAFFIPLALVLQDLFFLKYLAAALAQGVLSLLGVGAAVAIENGRILLQGNSFVAEIVALCSAGIEIAVVAGIVAATRDRSVASRVHGFALGTLFLLALNAVRIALTLLFVGNAFALVIVHDIFFRAFILASIVLYYALWYYWISRE